jgi:hypothetical protein
MSATTKILLALFGVTVVGGGGFSVYHFGSWTVKKSEHKGWPWRIVRHRGEYIAYANRPGFGESEIGKYPTKPGAMDAAIAYIDEKTAAIPETGVTPTLGATTIEKPARWRP